MLLSHHYELQQPPSTALKDEKNVNILQAPYMVRDAVELLEDQGS